MLIFLPNCNFIICNKKIGWIFGDIHPIHVFLSFGKSQNPVTDLKNIRTNYDKTCNIFFIIIYFS